MPSTTFHGHLLTLTAQIASRPLDQHLEDWLNSQHGVGSTTYQQLRDDCLTGVQEGWLCQREGGGIRYGRVFKPSAELQGYSVDVVDMHNIAGPHHVHPLGEIDLVVPIDADARFDGHGAGWLVMPPNSAHRPTVSQGRALVLYLLPEGRIDFSKQD